MAAAIRHAANTHQQSASATASPQSTFTNPMASNQSA